MAIATTIERDLGMAALETALDVAAERRRPTGLDRGHDTALATIEAAGTGETIGVAVAAEDIRHLQGWPHPATALGRRSSLAQSARLGYGQVQAIKRALRRSDRSG